SQYATEGSFTAKDKNIASIEPATDILTPSKRFSVTQILTSNTTSEFTIDTKSLLLAEHLGTKTHAILEKYRFYKNLDSDVISYFSKQNDFPFSQLMESAQVEWGFTYKVDNYLMEGKVDLWGVVDDELWIVDYKTGSDRYKEKAFLQLQYYSLPIRKFTNIKTAKLVVTYPFSQSTYVINASSEDDLLNDIKKNLLAWQSRNESLIQSL
ncbi:MAG: PD-(D/E)XK nuclease family protein, partial [Bdellovibrionales bacterium]|nr:PD-(D/E)XK nuclease family protein [Bdellovibrionales bacterium]